MAGVTELQRQAAEAIARWRRSPLAFVRENFKVEPDPWQRDALELFPSSPRMALKACKGPGKTAFMAWTGWNFLATRPHPKIAATSISGDNLRDCLWSEMAKWQERSEFLKSTFTWRQERIFANDHPNTWWMAARTWSRSASKEDQANTLAGLHADYMLFLIDESGALPDGVMAAAEAALASGIECHIVQAGNPTNLDGPLYRACSSEASLWTVLEITGDPDDPKRSPRVSAQWARDQIQKYGRENPWVLVNVFGKFPPSSINALLGPDDVSAAMSRHLREDQYSFSARVLGCDVARFGQDASVIYPRQGLAVFKPHEYRNVDSNFGGGALVRHAREFGASDGGADAVFVDSTGGFGASWIDRAAQLGLTCIPVEFAGKASSTRYANKRAEIHFLLAEFIKTGGGALPMVPELKEELLALTYTFKGDQLILESKDQIKEKIGRSPDHSDALATTFAQPVIPRPRGLASLLTPGSASASRDYDPHARA